MRKFDRFVRDESGAITIKYARLGVRPTVVRVGGPGRRLSQEFGEVSSALK